MLPPHGNSQCKLEEEITLKVSARVRVMGEYRSPCVNGSLGRVTEMYGGLVAGEGSTVAMDDWKVEVKLHGRERCAVCVHSSYGRDWV